MIFRVGLAEAKMCRRCRVSQSPPNRCRIFCPEHYFSIPCSAEANDRPSWALDAAPDSPVPKETQSKVSRTNARRPNCRGADLLVKQIISAGDLICRRIKSPDSLSILSAGKSSPQIGCAGRRSDTAVQNIVRRNPSSVVMLISVFACADNRAFQ
jgi:hypothetical protein